MFEPLHWPQCWVKRSALQRFLIGTWFSRVERRTYEGVCQQLERRDRSCLEAWIQYDIDPILLNQVSQWIRQYFRWPNAHFIAGDSMEILTFDYQNMIVDYDLSGVRLLMNIEESIGEVPDDESAVAAFRGTYGRFLEFLMRIKRQ